MYEIMDEFASVVKKLKAKQVELNEKLQQVDLQKEDICHYISLQCYTGPQGAKIMKQLALVLRERRRIKNEKLYIDNTLGHIPTQGASYYEKAKERKSAKGESMIYTFRTNVLKELCGDNYGQGRKITCCKKLREKEEKGNTIETTQEITE